MCPEWPSHRIPARLTQPSPTEDALSYKAWASVLAKTSCCILEQTDLLMHYDDAKEDEAVQKGTCGAFHGCHKHFSDQVYAHMHCLLLMGNVTA